MYLFIPISNNLTTIIVAIISGVFSYLAMVRAGQAKKISSETKDTVAEVKKNTDGIVEKLLKGKDETTAAKQESSELKGHAAGVAEKQIEIDQLNKDSQPKI